MSALWRFLGAASFAITVLVVLVSALRLYRGAVRSRIPTSDKLLRPPGESLNRKLVQLDEKLLYSTILFVGGPLLLAYQTQTVPFGQFAVALVFVTVLCVIPVWLIASARSNYALGYLGERAVGEELNQLLREGCHIFHDYPGGSNWNIDHIIVAPSGVYAVETKTRRKRLGRKGSRDFEVVFDGKTLHFPHCSDVHGLDQARRNAVSLGQQLTSATGEPVKAKAILTFPGWLVTLKGKSDVHVLNPKQIRSVVLHNNGPVLSPSQMQRIIHQLDQKCRDVEL